MEILDIGEERTQIERPYISSPRGMRCQHPDSIEEGEHQVPRAFEPSIADDPEPAHHTEIPSWLILASRNNFTRSTRPSTYIVPVQIHALRPLDDSVHTENEDSLALHGELESWIWEKLQIEDPKELWETYKSNPWCLIELLPQPEAVLGKSKARDLVLGKVIIDIWEDYFAKFPNQKLIECMKVAERFYAEIEDFEEFLLLCEALKVESTSSKEDLVQHYSLKRLKAYRDTCGVSPSLYYK
mmetsp:Transcript_7416/g.10937  ORF Transcript_7416/g.10937 Transcript_7416/m.10937 type:complete len:242 (-) Transcript_7416:43-768(-)